MKSKPIIGFANQKGGVGKTTWSKIFCEYSSTVKKKKTLAIDIDSQTSLTARYFGIHKNPVTDYKEPPIHPDYNPKKKNVDESNGKSSIADIFVNKVPKPYPTRIKYLDIIPADQGALLKTENIKTQDITKKVYKPLQHFIFSKDIQGKYDIFIIDTPPAQGPLTISAFKVMTHLVIPLEIELQSIEGLAGVLQLWKQEAMLRTTDNPLKLIGVLPNKVHSRRNSDRDLLEELRNNPGYCDYILPVEMIDRKEIPECDLEQKTIFQYPDKNPAKIEALAICKCIFKRI